MLRALAQRENLPSLADNLKTGNSLISGDADELEGYFGEDWEGKQPFDWEREYEPIMKDSGFDIIIGNPPYVRIQSRDKAESNYFRKKYNSPFGSFDLYVVFLEKALRLLKPGGRLGFITSGKFLKNEYGKKIRQILKDETTIELIIDLSELQVFPDATTYPVIIVFKKGAGAGYGLWEGGGRRGVEIPSIKSPVKYQLDKRLSSKVTGRLQLPKTVD